MLEVATAVIFTLMGIVIGGIGGIIGGAMLFASIIDDLEIMPPIRQVLREHRR